MKHFKTVQILKFRALALLAEDPFDKGPRFKPSSSFSLQGGNLTITNSFDGKF